MKTIITVLLVCISFVSLAQKSKKTIQVNIEIEDVKSDQGYWMLAIYNEDSEFLTMEPYNAKRQKVGENNNVVTLNLPKGNYAVAVFQDTNDNKNLDRNEQGIPTEPYSFSGENVFPLRGMPTFEQCKIKVSKKSTAFRLSLQKH